MRFLIDQSPTGVARKLAMHPDLIAGQLITPLTRYANHGGVFAIDNGAFSGLRVNAFQSLIERESARREHCLFVAIPDVVGSARRTLELWKHYPRPPGFPLAFVAQDGMEGLDIPWHEFDAMFIGGSTEWKDSQHAADIVKTAKALSKHVHIGRVNTTRRYLKFRDIGADTCDGSGVAMYDHMLDALASDLARNAQPTLWSEAKWPIK